MKPKVLILFAPGINRDGDLSVAFQQAGAETEIHPSECIAPIPTGLDAVPDSGAPGWFLLC